MADLTPCRFSPSQSDPDLLSHERTYHGFSILIRWAIVGLAVALTTLILWFATPAGFLGGAVVGVLLAVAGYYAVIRHEVRQPLDLWTEGR
ncbi:aa3-type cytochrome c oxidase subunit IV [Caulobacter hibisci]|uniref:Aa3-type cytochrome c oxidase subunit IV n=1 Tax=Caulobacter hibisci TaxID=2035993 RepID=A0ABS0SVD3_9CAUL|nr:aa3-type cytochrome c oxidase subunit IV [Caulobacter hibisci]MBI1683600.1 aa3-type cytochrome c oxidase subunit IV [Caulobacter hibisci]